MIGPEDLAVFYGRMRAGYDVLQPLQAKLTRVITGDMRMCECNSEEKRIAKILDEGLFKIAEALDELARYTWHTFSVDHQAKCAEDAAYLAEGDARKEYGKVLEVLCVERLPSEYQSEIWWRVTMREPEETDDDEV